MMTDKTEQEVFQRLSKIDENMNRVLFILNNDRETNQTGLVETVKILQREVDILKTEKKILYAKASVYGGIGAFLVGFLSWIIGMIFNVFFK